VSTTLPDPVFDGIASGWAVHGPGLKPYPSALEADVVIVGTGAGGGITAEILTRAGLKVVLVEEGPLRSSRDFHQQEAEAYPQLYQESAARKTADKAINILQGRSVGGSTTVNWTSSFRTPADTLGWWQREFGLSEFTVEALAPDFEQVEARLGVAPWPTPPNANNAALARGGAKLGIATETMRRNVRGCWNLGSCGLGCPTNAKQSMLVTTLPAALAAGATLLVQCRAERFELQNGAVRALWCSPVSLNGALMGAESPPAAIKLTAKHFVLAGGAINSPGLLLRSQAPDPHAVLGRRTFLHPVVLSAAVMPDPVRAWAGAPQTVYSDHFLHQHPIDGPLGFKLEVPPLHPIIFASSTTGFGARQAALLKQFPQTQVLLALLRDGFHPDSPGGRVRLRGDGSPELDYPLTPAVFEEARRALLAMAEIQFAAGAREVLPVHELAEPVTRWEDARRQIEALPMQPLLARVVSAHVMGGCALAASAERGVTRPDGVHWQIGNLSIHDGSLFPTSIGANPQVSVYGIVNRLSRQLAKRLTGREVTLA